MINVIVTGAAGRMGIQIIRLLREASDLTLVGAVERPGVATGKDAGAVAGLGNLGVAVKDDLAKSLTGASAQVVVDFTHFEASARAARICAEHGVALVTGSTGFTPEARAQVQAAAEHTAVVMSPNMSAGMNVMFELVRQTARLLGDAYDVEIVEMHHRRKKDSPSGTAQKLAEIAAAALERDPAQDLIYARHGLIGERPPRQIGVQALRGGDVVGEHTVFFAGEGERLEVIHRATSRDQFARGALRAARWVVGKPAGLYDMADVLGLKGKS